MVGVCLIQERCSYGSLGWTEAYCFTRGDLGASLCLLRCLYTSTAASAAAAAAAAAPLRRLITDISHGGRLTSHWDERCLRCLANLFIQEELVLDPNAFANKGLLNTHTSPLGFRV